jgi:hypothetical protein
MEYYNSSLGRWEPVLEKAVISLDFFHDVESKSPDGKIKVIID